MDGKLYVIATPIGNLKDITLRALETLGKADLIACEDTRVTHKLLSHYSIKKPLVSYHQHSRIQKIDYLIRKLKNGENVALVTDAGIPGISDPGNILVARSLENDIPVVPIPGPSALGTIISLAGVDLQKFLFLGFPPHKKGRETFFRQLSEADYPVIYFDSPHRMVKNLELLIRCDKGLKIIVGRELTKLFEEVVRGNISQVLDYFKNNPEKVKGEFTIIVNR